MKGIRAKLDYVLKHNMLINKCFKFAGGTVMKAWGVFVPVNNRAILFSGHGRKYNDSPRTIYEYMISQPKYQDYEFIWAVDNPNETDIPGKCIKVKCDTLKYFRMALSSKYWITCVNIERNLKFKKKNQIYLNTWHGTPIKTVGNDASNRKDYDFSYIDYFCVAGEYEAAINVHAFRLRESQMIRTGFPRNDELYSVSETKKDEIKKKLGIPHDKKVILYAPTWRDSTDGGKTYVMKPPIDLDIWRKQLADQFVLLIRTHPYTNKLCGFIFDDFARDFTDYPKINDLLIVSDILVSDYSGTIFDYSVLGRPIICFAYDYVEYMKDRGLYFDLSKEMPGGIEVDEEGVINKIKRIDYQEEHNRVVEFQNRFVNYGGNATKMCVEKIFG